MNINTLVNQLKDHAKAVYADGWESVYECYTDQDYVESLRENEYDVPKTIQSLNQGLKERDSK